MFLAALGMVLAQSGQEENLTFEGIEKAKYEAFANMKSFSGRYDVGTLPAGQRQSIYLKLNDKARAVRVVVDGQTVVESAWTKDKKWLINHVTAQYQNDEKKDGFPLVNPFKSLAVEKGRANFSVADMGPRFNTDPQPQIVSDTVVEESGKKLRRIESKTINSETKGEITIVQLFDEGTWITRRFSMEILADDKPVIKVNGFLRDDKRDALQDSEFAFPNTVTGKYQRVVGG